MTRKRLLAGATDYHLGGFRAVPELDFKPRYTHPLMIGTRCHMLAMYVVPESYMVSLCDYPKAYEGQAGFDFLTRVPTTWDETRVLDAIIGEFVTIARRKGSAWYLGSINNSEPRTIEISLDFLEDGEYTATIYRDGSDSDNYPNHIVTENRTVRNTDVIPLKLAAGGGQVMQLTGSNRILQNRGHGCPDQLFFSFTGQ
jgi:alpha-glucosidase